MNNVSLAMVPASFRWCLMPTETCSLERPTKTREEIIPTPFTSARPPVCIQVRLLQRDLTEPTATAPDTTGQLSIGGMAIDASGDLFFTDSAMGTTNNQESFSSNVNELPTHPVRAMQRRQQ